MVPATDLLAMRIGMAGSDALLQLHNHEALLLFALLFAWHVNALRAFFIEFHSETPFWLWSAVISTHRLQARRPAARETMGRW